MENQLRIQPGLFVCLALSLTACNSSHPGSDQERSAILKAERAWAAAAKAKDLDGSVSFMAEDATMFPPMSGPVSGKAAIREYMAAGFATPGFSVSWEPEDAVVSKGGDLAYTRSRSVYTVPGANGAIETIYGKGVTIWRKSANGEWRCVVDIWNDAPPVASAK